MIINANMPVTTASLNSVPTVLKEPLQGMPQMQKDELLREMERIWTTLSLSQKEVLVAQATRALCLNQAIDHLHETQMAALKVKEVRENDSA